jgi:hypothetical protein
MSSRITLSLAYLITDYLEQLFINFANEQLHQHFCIALFQTEQET